MTQPEQLQPADRRLVTEATADTNLARALADPDSDAHAVFKEVGNATYGTGAWADPDSDVRQTADGLYATSEDIASALGAIGGGTPATQGFELLASKIAFGGMGRHAVACASDSTANDGNDWFRVLTRKYGNLLPPSVRRVSNAWRAATNDWQTIVDAEGQGGAAFDGVVLRDEFNRIAAELVGSTPNVGPAWTGSAGVWSANGTHATANGIGTLGVDAGAKDATIKVEYTLVTSTPAASQTHRVFVAGASSANRVWFAIALNTSGGATFNLFKTIGNTSTSLNPMTGVFEEVGIDRNSPTPQTVTVELSLAIQNVTVTVTGPGGSATRTGTITESDYAALTTTCGIAPQSSGGTPQMTINRVEVTTAPRPASGALIEFWNGAIGGAGTGTFNSAKRAQIWGGKHIDVLVVGFGHNNGNQTGEDFATEIEVWVAAWMVDHPETQAIVVTSQNPQFAPAANPAAHAERQMAVRLLARRQGWDYIPAFEAFNALPDGGKTLIGADGVHPTTDPASPYTADGYGGGFWADAALRCITDRR